MKITTKSLGPLHQKEVVVPVGCKQCGKPIRAKHHGELCHKCLKKQ